MTSAHRSTASTAVHAVLLIATFLLVLGMFWNAVTAHFTIDGDATMPGNAIATYAVLAGFAVVLPVGGAIWSFVRGRWVLGIIYLVAIVVVVVAAFVFAVPHGALNPTEPPRGHATYTPCYSGSGTCPGG